MTELTQRIVGKQNNLLQALHEVIQCNISVEHEK